MSYRGIYQHQLLVCVWPRVLSQSSHPHRQLITNRVSVSDLITAAYISWDGCGMVWCGGSVSTPLTQQPANIPLAWNVVSVKLISRWAHAHYELIEFFEQPVSAIWNRGSNHSNKLQFYGPWFTSLILDWRLLTVTLVKQEYIYEQQNS